jgi:predicted  nucleic acid-binding Zn-ribbon protein
MPSTPIPIDPETTPVMLDACPGCGHRQFRVVARPPESAAAAWGRAGPTAKCYASDDGTWTWCSGTGMLTYIGDDYSRMVVSYERRYRKRAAADDPEGR